MKKIKAAAFAVTATIVFSGFFPSDTDIYFRIAKSIDTFGKIYKEISLNYVDKINPEEFIISGVKGMLTQLDPYTSYIDSKDQKDLDLLSTGKYGGIGITVGIEDDKVIVIDMAEGYSAQRQGVRIGDIILKVDDLEITPENSEQLSIIPRGEPGTIVKLAVRREGIEEPLKFELVREQIEINNIYYYGFIPENSNNAYLKLSGFSRTAGEDVKKALAELKQSKEIKSIVLDLRGNPGGLLDAAIDVCEKFLKKGDKVVSIIGRDSTKKKDYFSNEEPVSGDIPLAVLVDNGSASASEIVAGAIQDHDRGVIVGSATYGKGLVQTVIPLSDNTSLKMTTARYYTPSGRCIQKISYSEKNKVFETHGANKKNQFYTDKKRKVFSAGGIEPDSSVAEDRLSPVTMKLLAEGMFFKFANHYFNANPNSDIKTLNNDKLFSEFAAYIKDSKFVLAGRADRTIEQLKRMIKEGNFSEKVQQEVEHLSEELEKAKTAELERSKKEIVSEIRDELIDRMLGKKGMIKEFIKSDGTFNIAFNLLGNKKLYNKILNLNE